MKQGHKCSKKGRGILSCCVRCKTSCCGNININNDGIEKEKKKEVIDCIYKLTNEWLKCAWC